MSCDLGRLKSASALRDWEDERAKSFTAWTSAARQLLEGLRSAVQLGVAQHHQLRQLLSLRSLADRAYAQALVAGLPSEEPSTAPSASPVLAAISALQRSVSQLREGFALNVLEGSLLSGLANAAGEFEMTAEGLLAKLTKGVADAEQVNTQVHEAMTNFRRASIQDPRRRPASAGGWFSKTDQHADPDDGWIQEHRYRRAVAMLRERQRAFTAELCSAVEELRKLELWREEVVRKVLATFCTKLHQVETSVQSLANDGIKAMAGSKSNDTTHLVMKEMEKALSADLADAAGVQAPKQAGSDDAWPALRSLRALGRLGQHPPSSVLGKLSGALQVPRRWAGPQLRVVVLTKDAWLHCFNLEASRLQALSTSASGSGADVHGTGVEGLEALEAEPQWSLLMPHCTVTAPIAGKVRCFEIEESQKNFLGLRSSRKEILQAETDESLQRWVKALIEAGAENRSTLQIAGSQPPPPPPPPPKASSSAAPTPEPSEQPPQAVEEAGMQAEVPQADEADSADKADMAADVPQAEQPTDSPQEQEKSSEAEPPDRKRAEGRDEATSEAPATAADHRGHADAKAEPTLMRPPAIRLTAEDVFGE